MTEAHRIRPGTMAAPPLRDATARDRTIGEYRYLCRRGARKFLRSGLERSDLEQVASIGLIKATDRYDAAADTPFEAFAWLLIIGELMHYVRDYERIVRVPRRLQKLEKEFRDATQTLGAATGREPTEREVAQFLRLSPYKLAELREARGIARPGQLDELHRTPNAPETGITGEDRILLRLALEALPASERRVIIGVYLLGLTHVELGRKLGMRAKFVSRLHRVALGRMQLRCCAG